MGGSAHTLGPRVVSIVRAPRARPPARLAGYLLGEARDAVEQASATLRALDASAQALLLLRFQDGLEVKAMARLLDLSVTAVAARLIRARRAFRRRHHELHGDGDCPPGAAREG